jgi:hypothetical protein
MSDKDLKKEGEELIIKIVKQLVTQQNISINNFIWDSDFKSGYHTLSGITENNRREIIITISSENLEAFPAWHRDNDAEARAIINTLKRNIKQLKN